MICWARTFLALVCLLSLGLWSAPSARGQQAGWEYSPYKVQMWLAARAHPQLPVAAQQQLIGELSARARVVFGAVWDLQIERAPDSLRWSLAEGNEPSFPLLHALAPDALKGDKLIVVSLVPTSAGWRAEAKELDIRTRQWSPLARRAAGSLVELRLAAWDVAATAFVPVARIETVDGQRVVARLRAGGLIVDASSPARADVGTALRPVVRRNDRSGQPAAKGGIQAVPWTLLSVEERADSLLTCQLHSGYRAALPTRGGARTERLALVVRPQRETTTLSLRSRAAQPRPLSGYDVYARAAEGQEAQLVGKSDWRGEVQLPRGNGSVQVFLVKNGTQLLARLPLVPGFEPLQEASLLDDDGRLQAEGAVAALYSRALDLAARREILAARFRVRLKEQKFDEAQKLLDEFRQLESRTDLGRSLDEQQKLVGPQDKLSQQRIDKLFGEARKLLLVKALGDDMINALAAELAKARTAAKTAAVSNP